ncbi:MAG: hypothetical protein KJO23_00525 [Bacteroidia bacterium]|nr:hypothetical protein [Bacteroidia bacterium]NNM24260.1 hypothetical protein [Flavobacteriaceae bacterium]
MRTFLVILFIAIVLTLGFGLYNQSSDPKTAEFCIGISIAALFFVWMPFFIYHRWRKRDLKDYMLTKENIDKMRDEGNKKKL